MEYTILYFCLLGIGVIMIVCFFILFHLSSKASQWPTTTGKILFSEIETLGWNDERNNETYKVKVRYQYQVQDQIYISRRLRYGGWAATNFSSYAKKLLKRYRENSDCVVYYNPKSPQSSVLETTLNHPIYLGLFCGILFLVLGFMLIQYEDIIAPWMIK